MEEYKERISELAALMEEFRLAEASLEEDGFRIAFSKRSSAPPPDATAAEMEAPVSLTLGELPPAVAPAPAAPQGTPISSPMNGIYYASPSPSSPPFVKEGESVSAGQVVGLIEAMKVFNEIPATVSGKVLKIVAQNGDLVQPGDPLIYVG